MKFVLKRFAWNRLLVPLINLVCRADGTVLTSPSGEVEINFCNGWCGTWKVEAHGFCNVGFGARRLMYEVLPAYERRLRSEGHFEDADMLLRVLP